MHQDQTAPPAASTVAGSTPSAQTATTAAPAAVGGPYTAREMYEASQLQRRILEDQLSSARSQRDEVARALRQPDVAGVDKAGLEQRLQVLDIRLLDVQGQLADAQQREAQAAAVPGSEAPTDDDRYEERTEAILTIGLLSVFVLLLPLVLVQARRLWKKNSVVLSLTPELIQRLDSIDRAVEATAVEIERVGEGQRFVTQLLASRSAEPAKIPEQNP